MIHLSGEWWLDPGAGGWTLLRVDGKGRGRRTQAWGPFTSPRHVLQQRQVRLPKAVERDLAELVDAMEAGDSALDELPPPPGEKNSSP